MGEENLYDELLKRFTSLEASHEKLKSKIIEIEEDERRRRSETKAVSGCYVISNLNRLETSWQHMPGFFSSGSPFRAVLKCIGHAVCVSSVRSGQIIFWNRAAELLYGWDEREAVGQFITDIIVSEELRPSLRRIMERTCYGHTWHGQFVFRNKCGESFKALTASSPIYEDGNLVGIVTSTRDAGVLNLSKGGLLLRSNGYYGDPEEDNRRPSYWKGRPPPPVPHASVSNLDNRFLQWTPTLDDNHSKGRST